jgi:hypothetical protein
MTASTLSFRLAVLFVLIGIAMGIGMAASQNHGIMPAHAHLNLLGWVSLFLFGIYYERRPALDTSLLALVQVVLWSAGTVILTIAVAAIHLGYTAADPITAIASLVVLAAMLLFAYFVFRRHCQLEAKETGTVLLFRGFWSSPLSSPFRQFG